MTQQYDAFGAHETVMEIIPIRKAVQRVYRVMTEKNPPVYYSIPELESRMEIPDATIKVALAMLLKDPLVLTIETLRRGSAPMMYKLILNKRKK